MMGVSHKTFYTHCGDFIAKDKWPPNSTDSNPLHCYARYHVRSLPQAGENSISDRETVTEPARVKDRSTRVG